MAEREKLAVRRIRASVEVLRRGFRRSRRRHAWLDHLVRAASRYAERDGTHHAAAVAYYGFFAVFALGLVGYAVLGLVVGDNQQLLVSVQNYLSRNLPTLDLSAVMDPAVQQTAGLVGLLGLVVAGLAWVDALRSAVRDVWRLDRSPGNIVVRKAVDLLVLAGLGLLLTLSVAIVFAVNATLRALADAAGADAAVVGWLLRAVGFVLGLAINTALASALLTGLPHVTMALRRALGPALLVALGLEVIKVVGRLYIAHTAANPAYHLVAGAVGLLLFLFLFNQLLLFAAALTATGTTGEPTDLANRNRKAVPPPG